MTTRDYRYLLRAKRGCENLELTSDTLRFLNQFMTLIEKQFGNKCETVLSVPGEEGSRRIVDIRNGHITGRAAGDEDGNLGLEVAPGTDLHMDRFNYITTVRNGRILRSSTICMEDKSGKELCSLSVNFDITETLQMEGFLRQFNKFESPSQDEGPAIFDVNTLLERLIQKGQEEIGKPAEEMGKAEKVEFIRYLDEKGAFLITKSGEKICELLEISKFTFYSYLEKSRSVGEEEDE